MFGIVVERSVVTPLILTQSNHAVKLEHDRARDCYADPATGKFFRIEGDAVLEIDGVPPLSWTRRSTRVYEES
jgi:hypothetical protein